MDILKLTNTVKHLKFIQIYYRLYYFFLKPATQKNIFATKLRKQNKLWQMIVPRPASMLASTKFVFLNHLGELNGSQDWNSDQQEKLWLYNLHYFDDLNAENALTRQAWHYDLINKWIDENPYANGNGWEPYPTSLRIVNWVKWALKGNVLTDTQRQSLSLQAEHLYKNIEWHILANHLFANAKALIFVGIFFNTGDAEKWLKKGLKIYQREIREQVLLDGGNFELTPMYHAIFLEDLLDLYQLAGLYGIEDKIDATFLAIKIQKMLKWLQHMSHPDGNISFFNDAAFYIAPTFLQLQTYASQLGINCEHEKADRYLEYSGYAVIERNDLKLIIDVAKVGPDYQPGHAHADTLSFELSLKGRRIFVNSGTSQYGLGDERNRQRSTSAHNTVEVNNLNSSEVWAGFRVARRAYPKLENIQYNNLGQVIALKTSHDGYVRQGVNVLHQRDWIIESNKLIVTDTLIGAYKKAQARFYLHPDVEIKEVLEHSVVLILDGEEFSVSFSPNSSLDIEHSYWHPEFGKKISNYCLNIGIFDGKLETIINWSSK
ncbi:MULTISPECIES: heparinase II/III family protein [Acinetobacter]|uniref:heparinase II/III family protein n=1 Tax=Acinetobacter TaxID=469 RepID=UPI00019ADF96|nr:MULTISPECIES: heparinase II/III family protein [Acinetobacter]EEH69376.1 heparinase II/III-like protein [Acinetobacter sp. ATCC 27244]